MNVTFQNSAQVLSIRVFFTLMIVGLSATLPHTLTAGLQAHGVPARTASEVGHLPPISVLFASFLGYDPAATFLGPHVLAHLSAGSRGAIEGHRFFPSLIAGPVRNGLHEAFTFAGLICLVAAVASWSRGGHVAAHVDVDDAAAASESPL